MSTLAVNTITNAAGGNTAQINGMTPTADSLQGFRNRIINGNMVIDQRNAGASVTVNVDAQRFAVDRFFGFGQSSDGVFTLQQDSLAPAGFTSSIKATVTTADSSIASTQQYFIAQSIEGNNLSDLSYGTSSAQTLTLSFWVRSSVTGAFAGALNNFLSQRDFVFSYTINSANTWEYKTIVIPGDTASALATNNSTGFRVLLSLGAGSDRQQTVGTWQTNTGTFRQTFSGAAQLIATSGATFYITGVQLEAGSVATPFERIDYGRQLIQCQRYFQIAGPGFGWVNSAVGSSVFISFFAPMRASPTASLFNGTNTFLDSGVAQRNITGISSIDTTIGNPILGAKMDITQASTTTGKTALTHSGAFAFSAEL